MKKVAMLLMLIPFMGLSQLDFEEKKAPVTIGKVTIGSMFFGETMYLENHDSYVLFYKNLKYQSITDIKNFTIGSKDDFDSLFEVIINNTQDKSKNSIEVTLNNGNPLRMEFDKNKVQFWYYNGSSWSYSSYFNAKQIQTLMGN
jgi:hypothetical protein